MPFALLLAAAAADKTLIIMLAVIAVAMLAVLGLKFFRNLFEVITAPGASLRYHGQQDHFFFSLLLAILGGLIATIILLTNQAKIVTAFDTYASAMAQSLASGNSNPTYQPVAQQTAHDAMTQEFDTYFITNIILVPLLFLGLWLWFGTFSFFFARMFGGQVTWVDMLGTTAYSSFFMSIGVALCATALIGQVASMGGVGSVSLDAASIAGGVLILWGLVLFLMGVNQAAELTGGQTLGVLIGMVVLLGLMYFGIHYEAAKSFDAFRSGITSYNPAIGGGGGGGKPGGGGGSGLGGPPPGGGGSHHGKKSSGDSSSGDSGD